jgi:hypothetical protein
MNNAVSSRDYLESLMIWIRERPHMYCCDVGELDSVLWFLHMVWAKDSDREAEYAAALDSSGLTPRGNLASEERNIAVDTQDEITNRVLQFWSQVDSKLDIRVRVERWHNVDRVNFP